MSTIKSTMDIIMEKTRHLSMDRQELAELEAGELVKRVRGMVALYLEGGKDRHTLARDIQSLAREAAENVRRAWRDELLAHLTPTGSNERVFAALQFLESPSVAREWEGICREKTSFFLPEFERYKAEARESYRARLAAEGLSGSALVPADACNPFLKEAREELAKRFRQAVAAGLGLS